MVARVFGRAHFPFTEAPALVPALTGKDAPRLGRCHDQDGRPSAMCDYSLHAVASRPAKVGDKLVTTKFWNTTTRGFSSTGEPKVAVCLVPGTEVVFEDQVEREPIGFLLSLFKRHSQTIVHKVARFRSAHHDALEFPDGQIVLLKDHRV